MSLGACKDGYQGDSWQRPVRLCYSAESRPSVQVPKKPSLSAPTSLIISEALMLS